MKGSRGESARLLLLLTALLFLFSIAMIGCSNEEDGIGLVPSAPNVATCEGCHSNKTMLIAVAEPDVPIESEGEG